MVLFRRHEGARGAYRQASRAGLIVLCLLGGASEAAQTSKGPERAQENGQSAQSAQDNPELVFVVAGQKRDTAPERGNSSYEAGKPPASDAPKITDWIMAFSALFTLLFTVGLTVSTWRLWKETKRLAKGAEEQHATLKASVNEAAKAANAALKSTEALPVLERAYVFLSEEIGFEFKPGSTASDVASSKLNITLVNHGKTPAFIRGVSTKCGWHENSRPEKTDHPFAFPAGTVISAGSEWKVPNTIGLISADKFRHAIGGIGYLYLIGRVAYEDIFGQPHETGFCWEYNPERARFVQSPNEQLNYHW